MENLLIYFGLLTILIILSKVIACTLENKELCFKYKLTEEKKEKITSATIYALLLIGGLTLYKTLLATSSY
jgi:hypothetical protein